MHISRCRAYEGVQATTREDRWSDFRDGDPLGCVRLGNHDFHDFYIIVDGGSPYGSMDPLGLEIIIVGDPQWVQHLGLGGLRDSKRGS